MKESTLRKIDAALCVLLGAVLVIMVAATVAACAYVVYHTYVW